MAMNVQYGHTHAIKKRVFYTGTAAVLRGYAFCYDFDATGDGADEENPLRRFNVEKPSTTNNYHFAGVALASYVAKSAGQHIDIAEPGSRSVNVYAYTSCSSGNRITAAAGQWYFYKPGFEGQGTAICLQTVDRSTDVGLCQVELEAGAPSGLVEEVTPVDDTAIDIMVGGTTYFSDAVNLSTGDSEETIADGTFPGQRKQIICDATMTTNDVDVTVTHHSTSDPEHYFFKLADDSCVLEWNNSVWQEISNTAPTTT